MKQCNSNATDLYFRGTQFDLSDFEIPYTFYLSQVRQYLKISCHSLVPNPYLLCINDYLLTSSDTS